MIKMINILCNGEKGRWSENFPFLVLVFAEPLDIIEGIKIEVLNVFMFVISYNLSLDSNFQCQPNSPSYYRGCGDPLSIISRDCPVRNRRNFHVFNINYKAVNWYFSQ